MSLARGTAPVFEDESEPAFVFPTSVLNLSNGDQLMNNGLPSSLNRDKLATLLNIACRSFSDALPKMSGSNRYVCVVIVLDFSPTYLATYISI